MFKELGEMLQIEMIFLALLHLPDLYACGALKGGSLTSDGISSPTPVC